jgi:hypothetical protein
MKLRYALFVLGLSLLANWSYGGWDRYKTGIQVNNAFYDCEWAGAAPDFQGAFLGRYTSGGTLALNFGEVLTYKNGNSNVCGGSLFYRVYRTCDTPPSFTSLALAFCCNNGESATCSGGTCGPDVNNAGDQKWLASTSSVNWVSGLTLPGTYVVEVYFEIEGNESNPSGCGEFKYSSNSANNYRAYFEFSVNDSFTDANFTSPTWNGDTGSFTVATNSDAAGLIGTEQNRSYSARLNVSPAESGTSYMSTAITTWESQQEWYFWHGRRNIAASSSNQTMIWLYANESNLESGTVDGYRIVIGDDTGNDEIRLQRVDNGTGTDIFVSSGAITDNIVDWGVTFRVIRSTNGRWTIRTSTLPTAGGEGATALSCPDALSTVLHTNSLNSESYADDTNYTPSGTGYLGFVAIHSNSSDACTGQEFDNFRLVPLPPDTRIQFTAASATINENLGGGTYTLTISINDPSPTVATTANIVRVSGDAARINSYTTQGITFAAGSSTSQTVVLTVTNNDLCDGTEDLYFEIQSVAGGTNAAAGTPSTFALTIVDDNSGYASALTDDFEDGSSSDWTGETVSGTSGSWGASNSSPISGTYSLRHTFTNTAGSTQVHYNSGIFTLPGAETVWRFNLRTFNLNPSPANKWQVFLAANESNLWGNTVDGYALGVDPLISGDPDVLTLWRVDNGVMSSAIVTAEVSDAIYEWGNTYDVVGVEVTRSASGLWTLRVDTNGGFDNLSTIGTGTETTYISMTHFGMRFIHTSSNGGKLAIDDVSITQNGCIEQYYSRASGNFDGAIWSTAASGSPDPAAIQPGRWTSLEVQNGHSVSLNVNGVCDELQINSGGTLSGGSASLSVFGDWLNSGTFTAGTSTITMGGGDAQAVGGSATTRFHNLTLEKPAGAVNINVATEAIGVVRLIDGDLQTNGNLTLVSNSTGSGSVGRINTGATITGNVTLQRYIPGAPAGWVNLGCPIPGKTIADWNDDIITTGFTGSDYPPPGYTFNNIQRYDESVAGDRNQGWVPATNVTNVLSSTFGYSVYMTGFAQNLDVTGTIQSGSQNVSVPYTNNSNADDGWNLMTNIYPSEIDWVALEGNSSDFGAYYVWDASLPGYRSYNANSQTGGATRYIAHSQSFFVKATTFGQGLNYLETHKSATNAAFERNLPDSRLIRFRLERNGQADEALVGFVDGAEPEFESFDALKLESMVSTSPEFAFISSDGTRLNIDSRPEITDALSIPVYMDLPAAGTYTFLVQEVLNMQHGVCILMEDLVTGTAMPVAEGATMSITVTEPFAGERVMLHFSAAAAVAVTDATCFGATDGRIELTGGAGQWNYTLADGAGIPVASGSDLEAIENLAAGVYALTLENSEAACGSELVSVEVHEPAPAAAWMESIRDVCNTAGTGALEVGVIGTSGFAYTITDAEGNVAASGETTGSDLNLENLMGQLYTVTIETGCQTMTMEADLRDPNALQAAIEASANSIDITEGESGVIAFSAEAPGATGYTWTVDGVEAGTTASIVQPFQTPGTYVIGLEVTNGQCTATAGTEVTVNQLVSVNGPAEEEPVKLVQADGGVYVTFQGGISGRGEVRVINALGQMIRSERVNAAAGQRVFITTSDLAGGAYTVQVIADGREVFARSIVR